MTDKKLAELSASNAALELQSVATKKQIESEKVTRHQLELALDKAKWKVRDTEGILEFCRSKSDGLREESIVLRMELKLEKESHKVEKEGSTAVTLRSSTVETEPVVRDSPPTLNNNNRKRAR